jgi:hypothetical protein
VRSSRRFLLCRSAIIILILTCMEYTIIQAVVAAWSLLSLGGKSSSDFTNSVANLFFYLVLIILTGIAYSIRRQTFRAIIGITFILLSCITWYYVSIGDQFSVTMLGYKVIALLLWIAASCILIRKFQKKSKRRNFTIPVKRDTIHGQKNKCAICKTGLEIYGLDFHHSDGNRSNNKRSNCRALCTPCHRRSHTDVGN